MDHWVLYGWFKGSEEMMSASIFPPVPPISVKDLGWAIGYSLRAQFSFHLDDVMSFPRRRLTKREAFVSASPSGKESWWQQNDFCPIEVEIKKLRTLQGQLRSTLSASLLCLLCVRECFSLVGEKKVSNSVWDNNPSSHHFPSSITLTLIGP